MQEKETGTNKVSLMGKISQEFQFSYKKKGLSYYTAESDTDRNSGYTDHIPIMVCKNIHALPEIGSFVYIEGQFRSYNQSVDNRRKLLLNVLAMEIENRNNGEADAGKNEIFLNGYICKEPIFRKTPMGRYISDVCVAVNSPYKHSDYLPCIFWGQNAKTASNPPVGCHIQIWGRIQSRIYFKQTEQGIKEQTAYEVSVSRMKFAPV